MQIEKILYKGKEVIWDCDINPWEFRGHFKGQEEERIFLTFKWSEVERRKNETIRISNHSNEE